MVVSIVYSCLRELAGCSGGAEAIMLPLRAFIDEYYTQFKYHMQYIVYIREAAASRLPPSPALPVFFKRCTQS